MNKSLLHEKTILFTAESIFPPLIQAQYGLQVSSDILLVMVLWYLLVKLMTLKALLPLSTQHRLPISFNIYPKMVLCVHFLSEFSNRLQSFFSMLTMHFCICIVDIQFLCKRKLALPEYPFFYFMSHLCCGGYNQRCPNTDHSSETLFQYSQP